MPEVQLVPLPLTVCNIMVTTERLQAAVVDGWALSKGGLNVVELRKIAALCNIKGHSKLKRLELQGQLASLYFPAAARAAPPPTVMVPIAAPPAVTQDLAAMYTGLMSNVQCLVLDTPVKTGPGCTKTALLGKHHTHLIKDLTAFCTYGSSIFLRLFEKDMSYLEFMITGPAGTPYQNGLFHFSMKLPVGFPIDPPIVNILNTKGGKIRHNPNLYSCGKVCLSILNTWLGDVRWTAATRLSDVIVGIQNHIFNDDPWYNEPGHTKNAAHSGAYNHIIRLGTIMEGMIAMKAEPPPAFADVVILHFHGPKKTEIRQQIDAWKADVANMNHGAVTGYMKSNTYYGNKDQFSQLWETFIWN